MKRSLLQQSERKRKRKGGKAKACKQRECKEVKTELQKQSKAKPKFNMKDIRKCHHPKHGAGKDSASLRSLGRQFQIRAAS